MDSLDLEIGEDVSSSENWADVKEHQQGNGALLWKRSAPHVKSSDGLTTAKTDLSAMLCLY
jgi:hypothetical protein